MNGRRGGREGGSSREKGREIQSGGGKRMRTVRMKGEAKEIRKIGKKEIQMSRAS